MLSSSGSSAASFSLAAASQYVCTGPSSTVTWTTTFSSVTGQSSRRPSYAHDGFTNRCIAISIHDDRNIANQARATTCLTTLGCPGDAQRPLERDTLTEYRGAVGKLLRVASQTRPHLALGTSFCAQRSSAATVQDARTLNATTTIKQTRARSDFAPSRSCSAGGTYPSARGRCAFADSASARERRGAQGPVRHEWRIL